MAWYAQSSCQSDIAKAQCGSHASYVVTSSFLLVSAEQSVGSSNSNEWDWMGG
jgi:hypothetical protein